MSTTVWKTTILTVHVGHKEFRDFLCSERLLAITARLVMELTGSAFCTIHHYNEDKSSVCASHPHTAHSIMFRLR